MTFQIDADKKLKDYAAIGLQYARDVVSGKIPNGKIAIKACQRSLRDHERENFPFVFDEQKATKVCRFIEALPHVKGKHAGKTIKLEPWQIWAVSEIFGWIHASGFRQGLRRFRRVYIEVGRGNAKSTLSSALGLYMLSADGEGGAEVYAAATTRDQARIVFKDARIMALSPVCQKVTSKLGIQVHAHSITQERTNSMFTSLAADAKSQDGLNISLAIIDECHAHKTRDLWDVIETGCGKREQSIMLAITTAGTNKTGICYEQHTYLTKILDQVVDDESQWGCIWSADDDDDFRDHEVWRKANPNFGVSVDPSYLEGLARKVEVTPAAQNNFRTKHLCQWVSASSSWMDMDIWSKCGNPKLKLENYLDKECFIGLDLASVSDICAKVYLFPELRDDEMHYVLFGTYYLSEGAINDGRNSQYTGWQIEGHLTQHPGDIVDYGLIEDDLREDLTKFTVKEIGFDPYQSQSLAQSLQEDGATCVEVRPNVLNFSAPMKELERLARTGRLHHDGNPVLNWCASNVVCYTDAKDNIYPRKDVVENKIDAIVATITALARALTYVTVDMTIDFEDWHIIG